VAADARRRFLLAATATPAPDAIRRATDEVLSRPEYAGLRRSRLGEIADEVRAWFAMRLFDLVGLAGRPVVGWTVLALGVGVAALVVWWVLRGTRRDPVVDRGLEVSLPRRSAADWDAEARDAEARGDLRAAVRAAYRAVVAGLADRGLVEEVPGRTVGEYRRAVAAADPGRAAVFGRASDAFEAVWYAHAPATAGHLDAVRTADARAVAGSRPS
jgi:hypothetical protein